MRLRRSASAPTLTAAFAALGGRRRITRAALAFALGLAIVVVSAGRGAGAMGPWAGFVGMIALIVLVVGLAQASTRVIGAATGLLGAVAAMGGSGRIGTTGGALEDAAIAAGLLLVVEVGAWSGEARRTTARGADVRRVASVLGIAVAGGAVGGLAVSVAATTRDVLGGLLPIAAGALACCLVLLLALLLVPQR